jgi:hypothetical protein
MTIEMRTPYPARRDRDAGPGVQGGEFRLRESDLVVFTRLNIV